LHKLRRRPAERKDEMRSHALLDQRPARLVDDVESPEQRLGFARRDVEGDLDFLCALERLVVIVASGERTRAGGYGGRCQCSGGKNAMQVLFHNGSLLLVN